MQTWANKASRGPRPATSQDNRWNRSSPGQGETQPQRPRSEEGKRDRSGGTPPDKGKGPAERGGGSSDCKRSTPKHTTMTEGRLSPPSWRGASDLLPAHLTQSLPAFHQYLLQVFNADQKTCNNYAGDEKKKNNKKKTTMQKPPWTLPRGTQLGITSLSSSVAPYLSLLGTATGRNLLLLDGKTPSFVQNSHFLLIIPISLNYHWFMRKAAAPKRDLEHASS